MTDQIDAEEGHALVLEDGRIVAEYLGASATREAFRAAGQGQIVQYMELDGYEFDVINEGRDLRFAATELSEAAFSCDRGAILRASPDAARTIAAMRRMLVEIEQGLAALA